MSTADDTPVSRPEADLLFANLAAAPSLVLAVSGGPDSTALLWLAAEWRRRLGDGPELLAVTVDHGLRPGSADEAAAVARLARELGVAHRTLRWTGDKPASGIQAKARAARYELLARAARTLGARHILTAHTLDDQAETVLIRMARGSGMTGLGGMARIVPLEPDPESSPPARAHDRAGIPDRLVLVRPFLELPKSRLIGTLRAAGIAYADDPSNRDPRFTRSRMRGLMPVLAGEGLDARRLARLARRLRRADMALEAAVNEAASRLSSQPWPERGPVLFDAAGFGRLPAEIALRLLGRAVARLGDEGPVELGKLERLLADYEAAAKGAGRGPRAGFARFRRTLAGAVVTLARGNLTVERAPPRKRRGAQVKSRRTPCRKDAAAHLAAGG
ncbi:MAG TPA: tRNA lysidine(34) synthetase TilS [Xanthobacteraceae bacterium]|nr:tRNA lysidine(34) synthetase TilS [Xanthobacteraceae bacterium]